MHDIPSGFTPLDIKATAGGPCFEQRIGPLHISRGERPSRLGLWLEPQHCNFRGMAHGGLIASLCDMALAIALFEEIGDPSGSTISLNVDYIGGAPAGTWIETSAELLKTTGGVLFARCHVLAGGHPIANASGVFKLPRTPR